MKYNCIVAGRFLERPNRFIAKVEIEGQEASGAQTVHVKNTGRCRELLQKGAEIYLEKSGKPDRSTAYDLVAVKKGGRLVNMDSQAPNKAVEEWLRKGILFPDYTLVRPETRYGNSRFDFYVETKREKIFMEVKGVTLEEDGVVLFPDAPSDRAVKHVEELIAARQEGYRVFVMFVVQMEGVRYFMPNRSTHPEFADALVRAGGEGVEILAYDCRVTPESMEINKPVEVRLEPDAGEGMETAAEEHTKTTAKGHTVTVAEGHAEAAAEEHAEAAAGEAAGLPTGSGGQGESLDTVKETLRIGELEAIPKPLLKWYDGHRRLLPWREEPTPYRVWVSEVMLQQTRVEAVKPYFARFMKTLPDIRALAEADEEILLKLWEGLGYYNRVRNLQKAARQIQEEFGGSMPDTREELMALAGIGSYTAGAVASIAFGRVEPAVDGNVLRVLARYRRDGRMISEAAVKAAVEKELREIMPEDRPGDFNQAMMELGACVCIPNGAPLCGQCPLERLCMAHRDGAEGEYPKKQAKKPRVVEEKTVLVIRDENTAVVHRRAGRGLLAGMYEFPTMEGYHTAEEVVAYLAENGLKALRIQPLEDAKHIFTHREWHMKGYMVRVDELENRANTGKAGDWIYIEPEETRERIPIPSAFGAYTKYLGIDSGRN